KYNNSGNNDLYIYSNSGTVGNDSKNGCSNHQSNHTGLYTDRTSVSEQCSTNVAININKWNQWNMESCNNKYNNSRNNDLYIYSNSGTVCNDSDNGCSNHQSNHTGLYTDRTSVSEQCSINVAININKWN